LPYVIWHLSASIQIFYIFGILNTPADRYGQFACFWLPQGEIRHGPAWVGGNVHGLLQKRSGLFPLLRLGKVAQQSSYIAVYRFQVSGFGCQGTEALNPET
jgi:hypothetical protein